MNLRLAFSLLIPLALGCLGVKRGDEGGGEIPDGPVRDSGMLVPDGDVFIPEGCVQVRRVIDGDTFTYVNAAGIEIRVRLLGINTRERGKPCYGTGRNALSFLIGGQIVRIDGDDHAGNLDDDDRELRYASLCGSAEIGEVNVQMVRGGWACVYDFFAEGLMLEEALREAERLAAQDPNPSESSCWIEDPGFCNLSESS